MSPFVGGVDLASVNVGKKRQRKEAAIRCGLAFVAFSSIVFLAGITFVLFQQGLPIFKKVGLLDFVFGEYWYPTYSPPDFGIKPLILGSFWVTAGAMALAVPIGLLAAIFIGEIAPTRLRLLMKSIVELLAGIPSVVYGLFGMKILAPVVMRTFDLPTGLTALTAAIVLGVMAIPTITSISEDALSSVPRDYKEASLALGATEWETISRVSIPTALSGIVTAVLLGMGRAIGETMTVLMVAGGSAVIPRSLLQSVRPMTATIAAEMGEAPVGSDHYHALFAVAIVLFLLTLLFNIVADRFAYSFKKRVNPA